MGIRPISLEEMPSSKKDSNKMDLLANDIHEAMHEKVKYWEFTDFPYSPKTGISDIMFRARKIVANDFRLITGVFFPLERMPLTIKKKKDQDGKIHVYGTFNYDVWDELIEEARNKQK